MGILTILVASIHAAISLFSYRLGLYLFIFFYATYPRLFAIGIGGEGFALTAQRIMLLFMVSLFGLKLLYGSRDARRAIHVLRQEGGILLCLLGLLFGRLMGNMTTGRLDLTVVTGFADELFNTLFIVVLICCCLTTKVDVYKLWIVIVASFFVNELVAGVEFIMQGSIYPKSFNLDFETASKAEGIIQGGVRYGSYRVMGLFDSSLKLMAMGCLSLPIVWFFAKNPRSPAEKLLIYTTLIGLPIVVILTGSRTGIIVMVVTVFLFQLPFLVKNMTRAGRVLALTTICGLAVVALYASYDFLLKNFLFNAGMGISSASRLFQYFFSWPLFLESPLFGYGYARNIVDFIELKTLDGYYLRTVMEGGLVALGSLLVLFRITILRLRSIKRHAASMMDRDFAFALQISLVLIAIMMAAINLGTSSLYSFVICGSAIVLNRSILEPEGED